jgi:hypothetical protein
MGQQQETPLQLTSWPEVDSTCPIWSVINKQHPTQQSTNIMLLSSVVPSVYYHANNN